MADALPPALVLVGGAGTRLRAVTGTLPKPMAPIAGRPFLEYLLWFLRRSGVLDVVLCVGYGADAITGYFGDGTRCGLRVRYSIERELAGTGGALKLGFVEAGQPARCLVLNGDSFIPVDLATMVERHRTLGARVTLALARVPDVSRFGAVRLDADGVIQAFGEKEGRGPGFINAGIYVSEREVVEGIPPGVVSLEQVVLPSLVGRGLLGFPSEGMFLDIGIPQDYQALADRPEAFIALATGDGA